MNLRNMKDEFEKYERWILRNVKDECKKYDRWI